MITGVGDTDSGSAGAATTSELDVFVGVVGFVVFVVALLGLMGWIVFYLFSVPLRRQERARLFLDLLETALKQGRPVERVIVEVSASRDKSLGVDFHLLAAHVEAGLRLREALAKVPLFLPPQICAMLQVGEELGDLRKVLPACRVALNDAESHVRGAGNYLVLIAILSSPLAAWLCAVLSIFVFPKFEEILIGMIDEVPPFFMLVRGIWRWLVFGQVGIVLFLMGSAWIYICGESVAKWFRWRLLPLSDWIAWFTPWKRKRMQRNFSAMLAVLLDGGVPEPEALRLAGDCSANEIFRRRVTRAQAALAKGTKLTEAVQSLDDRGEFRWRLSNAVHAHGGFLRALTGWHEALDAKAFQQEQAAAHLVTSALVVLNGFIVSLMALAVFGALTSIIEAGVLW